MRRLTTYAATASCIKAELQRRYPGVKFSVTSQGYSGGSSVRVRWTDGPARDEIAPFLTQYEMGTFDGMTDCYNYDNVRSDIPQVRYVFADRSWSRAEAGRLAGLLEERNGWKIIFHDAPDGAYWMTWPADLDYKMQEMSPAGALLRLEKELKEEAQCASPR